MYILGGKIFVSNKFWASPWKNFRGCGILNHTPVLYMWYCFVGKKFVVRLSTTKTTKIIPPKNTRNTVYNVCTHMYEGPAGRLTYEGHSDVHPQL